MCVGKKYTISEILFSTWGKSYLYTILYYIVFIHVVLYTIPYFHSMLTVDKRGILLLYTVYMKCWLLFILYILYHIFVACMWHICMYIYMTGGMRGAVSMALALSLTLSVEAGLTTVDSGDAHLVCYYLLLIIFLLIFALFSAYFTANFRLNLY